MIGEDDVRGELTHRRDHALSCVDSAERAGHVGAAHLALHQGGVVGIVLDDEDPDRGGHRPMASGARPSRSRPTDSTTCRCADSSSSRTLGLPPARIADVRCDRQRTVAIPPPVPHDFRDTRPPPPRSTEASWPPLLPHATAIWQAARKSSRSPPPASSAHRSSGTTSFSTAPPPPSSSTNSSFRPSRRSPAPWPRLRPTRWVSRRGPSAALCSAI